MLIKLILNKFILSKRFSNSLWETDVLLFPEFINILSILFYNYWIHCIFVYFFSNFFFLIQSIWNSFNFIYYVFRCIICFYFSKCYHQSLKKFSGVPLDILRRSKFKLFWFLNASLRFTLTSLKVYWILVIFKICATSSCSFYLSIKFSEVIPFYQIPNLRRPFSNKFIKYFFFLFKWYYIFDKIKTLLDTFIIFKQ